MRWPKLSVALLAAASAPLVAQAVPTAPRKIIQIYRERLKPGMEAAHEANESGWPQAFAAARSPMYYLAMSSMTGHPEVLFVSSYDSYTSWAKDMASTEGNAELSAQLSRLATADGPYLESLDVIEARYEPDLSYGAFPDLNKQRFWNISIWRIRPGHDKNFVDASAAYMAIVKRSGVTTSWRTYAVTDGLPSGTFLMFSSVAAFGDLDTDMANGAAIWKAATPDEQARLAKFFSESVVFTTSNRYRLSPTMSYVSAETKATDPAFWNKK
jgi:hypothetical protein